MRPFGGRLPLCALLLTLCSGAALAAPAAPRPYSGCGVLTLKQGLAREPESLVLYQEPGVLRIAEKLPSSLPRLSGNSEEPVLAASERRGVWTRLSIDEAGRQGWLEQERNWEYASWRDLLPGRTVRLLPGLKKDWYALKSAPGDGGTQAALLSRDQEVRVQQVEGDWARLETPSGWFRWRDPDGRLTVSLQLRHGS